MLLKKIYIVLLWWMRGWGGVCDESFMCASSSSSWPPPQPYIQLHFVYNNICCALLSHTCAAMVGADKHKSVGTMHTTLKPDILWIY